MKRSTRLRKTKRGSPRKRADELFSLYIRQRDGHCLAANATGSPCVGILQCAHIISRSYGLIRWNPDNAVALCQGHHLHYTHRPLQWRAWIDQTFPGRWDVLVRRALADQKPDPKAAVKALELLLAEDVA